METKDETDNDFVHKIKENFPLFHIKTFSTDFNGIIGQVNVEKIYDECETDEKLEETLGEVYIEDKLTDFSKLYPNKVFGYIEMDCHGGLCLYEGFAVKNGEIIFKCEYQENGHVNILKKINNKYNGPFFEPFTRKFLYDNGY